MVCLAKGRHDPGTPINSPSLTQNALRGACCGKRATMPLKISAPLAIAGAILLALPACANVAPAVTSSAIGTDLGPSSRIPTHQMAMASRHDTYLTSQPSAKTRLVHDGHSDVHATGTVNAVDAAAHKLNLSHGPIPAIGWPPMTMDFSVAPSVDLSRLRPGNRVNFSLEKDKGGMYRVQSVVPAGVVR